MRRAAFSLVELLVVIGIIAVLIAILLPSLTRARQQAKTVQCQSNLRTIGQFLKMYEIENHGWLFPVGPDDLNGKPTTLGTSYPPHERWPMKVFKMPAAPNPPPYDSSTYFDPPPPGQELAMMARFDAKPYTPAVMVCPADFEPYEAHSYVLNEHLADHRIRAGSSRFGGLSSSDVIVAGEKVTTERDYYMEAGPTASQMSDYNRVVERYRHGAQLGSNFLKHDGHVDTILPSQAAALLDPWEIPVPATTQPSQ
jgi:prepilin-type N-terminal cleavage/methylation domain-containing protein